MPFFSWLGQWMNKENKSSSFCFFFSEKISVKFLCCHRLCSVQCFLLFFFLEIVDHLSYLFVLILVFLFSSFRMRCEVCSMRIVFTNDDICYLSVSHILLLGLGFFPHFFSFSSGFFFLHSAMEIVKHNLNKSCRRVWIIHYTL